MTLQRYPTIEQLVPHRAPMILIDDVVSADGESISCSVNISADSIMFDETLNGIPAHTGIEFMAQSIAALAGLNARAENQPPSIGFLLGARRYKHYGKHFENNKTYLIHAELLMRDDNMGVYNCQIECGGQLVAKGQVNTYAPEQAFLAAFNQQCDEKS
ncbi:3-hydroxydecanoyl-ACP dehydratase [Thaumasiovibrio sp. DFM-14]|uniref:ApeP family dehydratase n=1 Tax=Thaumasiovibrio sp. DFM-14 TaxID=3384792 RepID=UPI0039A35F3E